MARKKKNKHIVLIIFGIVVLLLVLNWFGVFDNFKGTKSLFVTVPIDDICLNSSCEINSPYTCPTDVSQCKVRSMFECNIGGEEPNVVFRTNVQNSVWDTNSGIDGKKAWVSYSTGGGLVGYDFSEKIPLERDQFPNVIPLWGSSQLVFVSGIIYITKGESAVGVFPPISNDKMCSQSANTCKDPYWERCSACGIGQSGTSCLQKTYDCGYADPYRDGQYYYKFLQPSSSAVTLPGRIEPYNSNLLEKISGSSYKWNCQGSFQIRKPDGSLYYSEPDANLRYQSNNGPGNRTSTEQILPVGYTVSVSGGDARHLYYGTYKEEENCASGGKGKCLLPLDASIGYKNCENGIINPLNITYCETDNGLYCLNGACVFSFQNKEIKILDSDGNTKTGFTSMEQIKVSVKLQAKPGTPLYGKIGMVKLFFYKTGDNTQPITNSIKENFDFNNPGSVLIPIDNPGANGINGLYYLVIKVNYDSTKPDIVLGLDNPNQPDYQISIGSSVECSIQLQTSVTDVMTSKLLTNIPILVKLNTKIGGLGSAVQSKNITVYMNKGKSNEIITNLDTHSSEGRSGDAYTYIYNYLTDTPGDIYAVADISDSGVPTRCTTTSEVEDMTIITNFYNVGGSCLPPGEHTFYFETLDTLNRPTETINTLYVKKPGSGTSYEPINNSIQLVSGGKVGQYEFTYNLIKNVGETAIYTFLLTTHSNEYNRDYVVPDKNIEVKDNCVSKGCTTTKYCQVKYGDTYICNTSTGKCTNSKPQWMIYAIIGIVAIIGIIILIFIIKAIKNRKPKQDFYTGLEGL